MDSGPPSPSTQGQQPEVSRIVQIAQIKRVSNVIVVKSLILSASTYRFQDFKWREFQLVDGAKTALQSLPKDLQSGDAKNSGDDEVLFGLADENLPFWAMGFMKSEGWAVEVPSTDRDTSENSARGDAPKRQKSMADYEKYLAGLHRGVKETWRKFTLKMN